MDSFLGQKHLILAWIFWIHKLMIRKHFFDNDVDLEITRFLDSNELLDKGVKKPVLDADDAKIQEYITGNKAKETKYKAHWTAYNYLCHLWILQIQETFWRFLQRN